MRLWSGAGLKNVGLFSGATTSACEHGSLRPQARSAELKNTRFFFRRDGCPHQECSCSVCSLIRISDISRAFTVNNCVCLAMQKNDSEPSSFQRTVTNIGKLSCSFLTQNQHACAIVNFCPVLPVAKLNLSGGHFLAAPPRKFVCVLSTWKLVGVRWT